MIYREFVEDYLSDADRRQFTAEYVEFEQTGMTGDTFLRETAESFIAMHPTMGVGGGIILVAQDIVREI